MLVRNALYWYIVYPIYKESFLKKELLQYRIVSSKADNTYSLIVMGEKRELEKSKQNDNNHANKI